MSVNINKPKPLSISIGKFPRDWDDLTLDEQEAHLVEKFAQNNKENDAIRSALATIRGGKKVKVMINQQ